jgi:gliding motility-associated-like protein
MRYITLFFLLLFFFESNSQVYSLTGNLGTITTCSGTFYDSGGSGGTYANGEDYTVTFCSGNGLPINLSFTQFQLEASFDFLYVYNGPSTASPSIGTYNTTSPGIISASSGCITLYFHSDLSVIYSGWEATISCGPIGPTSITATTTICSGQTTTLTAIGGTGTINWYANACGTTNSIGTGTSITLSPTTTTTYYANSSSAGTYSSSCASITVTVNSSSPAPTVTGTTALCGNGSTTLTAANSTAPYTWYSNANGTGVLATGTTYTTPTLTANTTYYVGGYASPTLSNTAGSLATTQAGGNGCTSGNMFDVTAGSCPVVLNGFTVKPSVGGTMTVAVYYKTGTFNGFQLTPGSWTFLGNYSITATAANNPTYFSCANISIPAGATYGIYVSYNATYTNGANTYTNGDITITTGLGLCSLFGGVNNPRTFNGTVHYQKNCTTGCPAPLTPVYISLNQPPVVNAGPDVTICNGQSTTLNGSASSYGGYSGPLTVNVFSGTNLDETTWTITNSLGQIVGSGGPYLTGSNNTVTINSPTNPPYTFSIETQGVSNSNVAGYNILCGTTTISGGVAIITGGQTASVSIAGCPGPMPASMLWSPGATLSSTTIATPTATPTATTTYTLTATANGCMASDQVLVTVISSPSVTVNNATICSGQTATLTATPSVTGGTYLWTPGGATTQSITVSPSATTSYSVTYTSGACPSIPATGIVTVSAAPTISVNSSTICPGASATLTATASPTGGTYTWTPGNTTGSTLTVTPSATTTYSVSYSLNGCSSTTASGTITVANTLDFANIQSPGNATICQGQTLTIYGQVFELGVTPGAGQGAGITVEFAYSTSNTNPNTWPSSSWTTANYNPSGTSANNDEYTGVIPALGTGTYYFAFRYSLNGCVSYGGYSAAGGGFWNGTTNVNGVLIVNPNITPTFNSVAAICAGSALNALPTTSTNAITGSWSPALSNQLTTTYTFTPAASVCATTTTLTITVNPLPIAAIAAPTTTVLTCSNPSITLTASGGGTYSWSNGTAVVGTNASLVVTTPGTYTVTVTSANGCAATAVQTITQNITIPTAGITPPSTSVLTCTTTSINLTATGGGTYSWSNGTAVIGTNATLSVNTPGTYTVTVTAANGCSASASQIITQNITAPTGSILNPVTTQLNCTTSNIDLIASGGGTYSWANGTSIIGTSALLNVSAPGTYVVTVTAPNGCTATATQTITQNINLPNAVIATPTTTILNCTNTNIVLTGSGGGTYSWFDGSNVVGTNANLNVTAPNTYILTVVGSNGCIATTTMTITEDITPPTPSISAATSNLTCTTTSIVLTGTGGGTYSWTGGTTGANLTVTNPGTYTVTVTAPNGCSASEVQTITQNITVPSASINASNNGLLTCSNTSITLTATGGGSYVWSTGSTTSSITVNTPGTFPVTVTGANGCTSTASQTITQNTTPPSAAITPPITTVLTCTTTSITLTATGGGTYSWSNGTAVVGTNATLSVTSPGTYTVTVTGANGCTASASQIITQSTAPPTVAITPPTTTVLTCASTSISLTATGGGTYSWSNGTAVVGTNATLAVTTPGTYTVTVTSANGCTANASQVITQNISTPVAGITAPTTSVLTCATTSISLIATGGGTYSWSNGTAVVGTNATLSVNTQGTYTVTVTSANGCTATAAQIITQSTALPTAAITAPTTSVLTCATTSISLTATGGGTYSWSNGTAVVGTNATLSVNTPATYTVTVTGANGCTATAAQIITQSTALPTAAITAPTTTVLTCTTTSISLTATGGGTYSWSNGTAVVGTNATLAVTTPGSYTVTVTSPNGCTATAAQVITQNITNPTAAINAPTTTVLTCTTTSISLTATGGGNYSWSNGTAVLGTNATLAVTTPGTYTVTVTSPNGCTATAVQVVTQNITLPTISIIATPASVLSCTNASITLTASGGVSYSWSNGTAVVGTNATLTVTSSGTYTVTVAGTNGCTASSAQIVTQNTSLPAVAITTPTTSVLTCSTTSISLTGTGGGTYSWSNGTAIVGTNATLSVTTPGTYTVTVTSSNGCTATASQVITQNTTVPTASITAPSTTILTCTTPSIALTATGGGTYSWSNGTAVVGTNATLNVTTAGTYTVTVTAANGCTATATQVITQNNSAPPTSITPPTTTVLTCTTTSISLIGNGTGNFAWTNPAPISLNPTITVTTPGVYTLTITAANGCTGTATQTITQNITAPAAAISALSTSVLTCTTTSITLTATGGGTYSWSNGTTIIGTNATLTVTTPGTYTVTVTGTNGCTATAAQTITQNITAPTAGINTPTTTILTCTTTSIPLTAIGGGTYSWSNGTNVVGTTPTLTVTAPGTYTVTVTAANGCTATSNQVITQDIVTPVASITNNTNSTILDCNTTQISLTGNGGTSASWSNGTTNVSNTAALTVTTAGTYTYIGTNANGCFDTESITITFTPNTNPIFTQIAAICTNGTFTLPTTSTNNVAGTWSPTPNYTATTTYTFQPNTGLCANTASMTITVHPYPVVTIQNDTICAGGSATITANVNLAGGSYTWSPIISATNAITVTPNATANYQVIYTLLGCADTSTAELFVKPVSIPSVANETICNGQTAELIATAPISGGSFVWSTTTINDTIQVSPSTTTNYSVVYNLNGCVSPIVNSTVTVNPVPTLGINNSTICAGDNTTVTAVPNLLGGTFYWGTPGVAGAASQTVSPLNDTTISVYYTLNGCSSPMATSSITVNPLPIATFSASVTQGCAPLSVTLTADDASNTNYSWSTSNALTGSGSQTNFQFQMNGGFDVSLTATLNGCTVTETVSNYVQVDNYPIAAFEPSSTLFTEPNQTLNFMNNSLGASTYSWDFGDGGTSTEEGPSHLFNDNNLGFEIILTAISTLGCVDTSHVFIGYDPGLVYYIPNTFTPDGNMYNETFLPIFTSGIDNYHYNFYVYNRWGEIIFESQDPSIGWDGSFGLEGKDCEQGVYTYQIFIKIPNFDERKMILGHVNLIR